MANDPHVAAAAGVLRSQLHMLRRVPELLKAHPAEAETVRRLIATVDGERTNAVQECAILWKPGQVFLATAVFLGGRWLLTAKHVVEGDLRGHYLVTLPAEFLSDIRPANSFPVDNIFLEPGGADLALLSLASDTLAPGANAAALATEEEFRQAGKVRVCGFGSNDCTNPSAVGDKRISADLTVIPDPVARQIVIDSATEFAADDERTEPITCPADSGGGAFVSVNGQLKLAGTILGTARGPQNNAFTRCVHLALFIRWIRKTTGLTI